MNEKAANKSKPSTVSSEPAKVLSVLDDINLSPRYGFIMNRDFPLKTNIFSIQFPFSNFESSQLTGLFE